jgi:hypothetical protein
MQQKHPQRMIGEHGLRVMIFVNGWGFPCWVDSSARGGKSPGLKKVFSHRNTGYQYFPPLAMSPRKALRRPWRVLTTPGLASDTSKPWASLSKPYPQASFGTR